MSKNLSELSARQGLENNLFEKLTQENDKQALAEEYLIGQSSVRGAISFYDFLKDQNKDKKVYICNGSACLCAGTQAGLKRQLERHFKAEEIGHMTCLGRCHENAAFHYQGTNYSNLDAIELDSVINNISNKKSSDHYSVQALGEQILTGESINLEQFTSAYEQVLCQDKNASLEQIKKSQLRGRGGAGFPISFKIKSVKEAEAEHKYLICNADEGDPGAYSDRYLLEKQPLLVLFGMAAVAHIMAAEYAILYIRGEYPEAIEVIDQHIKQLAPIVKQLKFKIIAAQGAYICGEETALINSIEGQRPEVRTRPPFPTQRGLFNQPTVVNNVETLASIYAILTKGGEFYRDLGTENSKGTKLVSLDSFFNKAGIYEVEMGTPLTQIIERCGGGFKQKIKALHIGGPLGGIVPVDKIAELSLDFESFSTQGFLLGHASVVCIPDDFPMIDYLHHLFEFAAYESCGKCFPCRLGTKRGEELLTNAIKHGHKIERELFEDLLETLQQGSLCAHGGGIPLPVNNALQYFSDELAEYFS